MKSVTGRRPKQAHDKPSILQDLPSDDAIATISALLVKQSQRKAREQTYARAKDVLSLLGTGVALSAAILAPGSARVIKPLLESSRDWDEWKHFNISYLQRTLRQLNKQKDVEISVQNGEQVITLTKNGKRRILKYNIDQLTIDKPKTWDGKWRLVLYDVPVCKKQLGDLIRQSLKMLGFYPIQDSVYLHPYPCFDQIEFLREYYFLGDTVQYMLVDYIERDDAFKTFFNLS